jgi:hypothetical protein
MLAQEYDRTCLSQLDALGSQSKHLFHGIEIP